MRRLQWGFLLALSTPLWVVGLVLVPVYFIERLCYSYCLRALQGFMAAMRNRPEAGPLSARDRYFAKARNARKARKVVRP